MGQRVTKSRIPQGRGRVCALLKYFTRMVLRLWRYDKRGVRRGVFNPVLPDRAFTCIIWITVSNTGEDDCLAKGVDGDVP